MLMLLSKVNEPTKYNNADRTSTTCSLTADRIKNTAQQIEILGLGEDTEKNNNCFVKMENNAFINGDGIKKPRDILSPDHDTIEKIKMGNKITADGLLDFINSLKAEYLVNATLLMNRITLSEVQKLKDHQGRFIWQSSLSDSLKQIYLEYW
ncbi:phage major capsid protein [Rickettsia rhipicephali]|uniref:Phage major capsid protein, HK97 family n=2 Tax=spotted fever group TaxID=114277 RepID=A0A0F3PD62_RICRH|nr:phage major capsid protein [Rickettsia rhipicephali]KJV78280.1 phage major capsid protein, HK97 family [Rickettsia rhipicephali str. Ect]